MSTGGTAATVAGFDAIVLAGGRGRRVGGVDKPGLLVGGAALVASVAAAVIGAGAERVILVGPPRPELTAGLPAPAVGWVCVREEPAGSGPVPALTCGLVRARASMVVVTAADLPFLRSRHVLRVVSAVGRGDAGAIMVDESGREQWLLGCWRTQELRQLAERYTGNSLHGLLRPLGPAMVDYALAPGEPPPWLDCDTSEDLARARGWPEGKASR